MTYAIAAFVFTAICAAAGFFACALFSAGSDADTIEDRLQEERQ